VLAPGGQDLELLEKSYASVKDYHLDALRQLYEGCHQRDPAKYVLYMQKACEMNPDLYVTLGDYLVEKQKPDDAAAAYQSAFELAPDRVMMANKSQWLVDCCFGPRTQRRRLEDRYRGGKGVLLLWAGVSGHLMERMERWKEAETAYLNIEERYQKRAPLNEFYLRYHSKDPSNSSRHPPQDAFRCFSSMLSSTCSGRMSCFNS